VTAYDVGEPGTLSERKIRSRAIACLAALALSACGSRNTASNVDSPGSPTSARTATLEMGAAALQSRPPIDAINAYLDGFHFYNGNIKAQMEAHHYCTILNEELIQCVIYDGNVADAKLMGVEYIVSARLFGTLPENEKALWHSHVHEVSSGQLIAPGIPQIAEHALMSRLIGTYGKTFHTWHTDQQKDLPTGVPQVMMGFTADGQIDPALVAARDERFGVRSEAIRAARSDIPKPSIDAGADAWKQGRAVQLAGPPGSGHEHVPASAPTQPRR
jgi:uncharacterized protein DUF1264